MNKECVFLSNSNIVLFGELRNIAKKYDIDLKPCKYIFEMLDIFNQGTNAVLIEKNNNFDDMLNCISDDLKNKVFYYDNGLIYDYYDKEKFENIEQFFKSNSFNNNIYKKSKNNYDEIATSKLYELGIVMNSWKARFIRYILCEMKEQRQEHSTKELILSVSAQKEVECRYIYDILRPLLKEYAKLLKSKTKEDFDSNKVRVVIDKLYNYVFK